MRRSSRRLFVLVATVPLILLGVAVLYMLGMERLEGEPRSFSESIEWAAETLTATGYGRDTSWGHPAMVVFVIVTQFMGVAVVFLVFGLYLVPFFEETFEGRLPRALPKMRDYVLIYRYGPAVAMLLEELTRRRVPAVVFEEDEATARRLLDRGRRVVYGKLEDGDPDPSLVARAKSIVVNGTDHDNGALILAARQQGFAGEILALAEDPLHRDPMLRSGASAVYTPKHMLAAGLAARASEQITPRVPGLKAFEGELESVELRVDADSKLAGRTLRDISREHAGLCVVGCWKGGEFCADPGRSSRLEVGMIATLVGRPDAIARAEKLARPIAKTGPIVVAGHGGVGKKLVELLADAGEETRVIDRTEGPGVDVVGNALDHKVWKEASVLDARAVTIALERDSATMFATSVLRNLAPHVPIIVRVERRDSVVRIHQAGADFALSLGQVAGQLLTHHVLGGESPALESEHRLVEVGTGGLVGRRAVDGPAGCCVVAVRRGKELVTDIDDSLRLERGDRPTRPAVIARSFAGRA
jgi:Trk K+ transport system NAD-binding subunit